MKMKNSKHPTAFMLVFGLVFGLAFGLAFIQSGLTALAQEKIEGVYLTFVLDQDSQNQSELNVEAGDDTYYVKKTELYPQGVANLNTSYPVAIIVLETDEHHYFSGLKRSDFYLEGAGASFLRATKQKNTQITLAVRLAELGPGQLEAPRSLLWNEKGIALWESVAGAGSYSVRLRKDGKVIGVHSAVTAGTQYNFASQITTPGEYDFQVRANGAYKNTQDSDWATSPPFLADQQTLAFIQTYAPLSDGALGRWIQDETGWWYQYISGSYPVSDWREIDDEWYYFNEHGYMAADQWIEGFYVGADGKMLRSAITPDGKKVDEYGMVMSY